MSAHTELGCLLIRSQGKVVCLVSGGIDSPVAAWLAMRKGCTPIFLYYDNSPFTDETTKQRAIDTIKRLREHTYKKQVRMYVIPHGEDLAEILRNCPRNLTCILCRRMMYRVAEKVALMENAGAIVTGEIIGEHASQTLRNLRVENEALSQVSILRPIVGFDKLEVERLARKIGTFDASTRPASCCSAPPKKPRTRAKFEEVRKAERRLKIEEMITKDLKEATVLTI